MGQSREMDGDRTNFFQLGDTRINLAKVEEVAQAPQLSTSAEEDQLVLVLMKDRSVINIRGKDKVEAFLKAIDSFIEHSPS